MSGDLSPRVIEAMRYVIQGLTDAQIGRLMGVSERTVETMVRRAKHKLGIDGCNRITLIHTLLEHGYVSAGRGGHRRPLTDDELYELARKMIKEGKSIYWFARAVEAAHGVAGVPN